ncbi:hypothetical protein P0D69_38605, partial [Paraburkholderia sediminicola]
LKRIRHARSRFPYLIDLVARTVEKIRDGFDRATYFLGAEDHDLTTLWAHSLTLIHQSIFWSSIYHAKSVVKSDPRRSRCTENCHFE